MSEEWWKAAAQGNNNEIIDLLNMGVEIDARDSSGRTALYIAALHGRKATAKLLVQMGSKAIDMRDCENYSPIMWAVKEGDVSWINLLVKGGSRVFAKETHNSTTPRYTLMQEAASHGQIQALITMVRLGSIAIDTPDVNGYTPMHWAIYWDNRAVIEVLAQLGSIVFAAPSLDGLTPIDLATNFGFLDCEKTLLALNGTLVLNGTLELDAATISKIRYSVYFSELLLKKLLQHL